MVPEVVVGEGRDDVGECRGALLLGQLAGAQLVANQPEEARKTVAEPRAAETARLLGATYGRLQSELLTPLIARCLAMKPEVILFDEPCSALDPISTAKVEELIDELKEKYTIAIVTHNMQQAARCSDYTAYMYLGELVEFGETEQIFFKPNKTATEDYITGRFG